jgi:quinol monooxygenase YgiN
MAHLRSCFSASTRITPQAAANYLAAIRRRVRVARPTSTAGLRDLVARQLQHNTDWQPRAVRHSTQRIGGPMAFELSAHMTIRPGQLEGFKKQAAECIRITKEKDTHTLRYDWFITRDGTECEVREAYTGPEGLIEHNRNIIEARTKLFTDYADNHLMTVYSEPIPEIVDLVKAHHLENQFKWFSFVKGLDR